MRLVRNGLIAFDYHFPMYNWFYPLEIYTDSVSTADFKEIVAKINDTGINRRALYFHIPFCETICSFCPFIRGRYKSDEVVELYTQALVNEIRLKTRNPAITSVPIDSIFFGGGTPSVLSPDQIRRIGAVIHECFDLSRMREFSFEVEVKSIDDEKADAMRSIGVTHGRFGLQTFDENYRKLFTLTATLEQCEEGAKLLARHLPHVSFDILYSMNGQTFDQLVYDLERAAAVGTNNIDIYPVNNLVTQLALHRSFAAHGLEPLSAMTKLAMRMTVDEVMRGLGFLPHNGHGYVRSTPEKLAERPVVTDEYSFLYHEAVYGYGDVDLIGFGASAVSLGRDFNMSNESNRNRYTQGMLQDGGIETAIRWLEPHERPSRGVIGHLPYHGELDKAQIDWDRVHPDTRQALNELIATDLVADRGTRLELTWQGWLWYVNLIYYLMPKEEQEGLDELAAPLLAEKDRKDGKREFPFLHPMQQARTEPELVSA